MSAAPDLHARTPLTPAFVESLRSIFRDRLHLGETMRAQHGSSETHFATALPDAVVFPHSTEEVVALVKACVDAGVPVVPYGAGTSVEGNTTPCLLYTSDAADE